MYILVKLNSNQGTDLGPNFTLTANVGTLVPATATLAELLVGVTVLADNTATQVFVTSQGICTNALTIAISPATTTTTSTTTTSTTTTNADCLLAGGTVVKSPYVYYPNNFVFGVIGGCGSNNICIGPTTPVYGPPCDPGDPLCIFNVPAFLFLDPYGATPFTGYSFVRNNSYGFLPSSIYNYNTTTGAVGAYVSSCL
jgi:hypothetical protein